MFVCAAHIERELELKSSFSALLIQSIYIKKKKKKKKKGNLKIYIVVSSILLNYLFLLYDEVMIMGKV
jgi:hypothetical protein